MKEELEKMLFERYPKIFGNKDKPMTETCMCWGIECPDSWFDMLDSLCKALQWDTDKNDYPQIVADQVKEKFGTLRFYYHLEDMVFIENFEYKQGSIDGTVEVYENISSKICCNCGINQNITCTKGWVKYICKDCLEKENKEKENDEIM